MQSNLLTNAGVPSPRVTFPPWTLPVTLPHQAVHSVVEQLLTARKVFFRWSRSLPPGNFCPWAQVCPPRELEHWELGRMTCALCRVLSFTGCLTHPLKWFPEGLIRHAVGFNASDERNPRCSYKETSCIIYPHTYRNSDVASLYVNDAMTGNICEVGFLIACPLFQCFVIAFFYSPSPSLTSHFLWSAHDEKSQSTFPGSICTALHMMRNLRVLSPVVFAQH